MNMLCSVTVYP